jgi:hypothetical protein
MDLQSLIAQEKPAHQQYRHPSDDADAEYVRKCSINLSRRPASQKFVPGEEAPEHIADVDEKVKDEAPRHHGMEKPNPSPVAKDGLKGESSRGNTR